MAFTKSFRTVVFVLAATTMLASCAKKDSDFKGRKNAANAAYVGNPQANAQGQQSAAAANLSADITAVNAPVAIQGGLSITSEVIVNNQAFSLTTNQSSIGADSSVNGTVGAAPNLFNVTASGRCVNKTCSPYYIMLNFSKQGQPVYQLVMKKNFIYEDEGSLNDFVLQRGVGAFLSFDAAIGILDQGIPEGDQ